MNEQIKVGSIWKEADPRFNRHVRITTQPSMVGNVHVRTVIKMDGRWIDAPKSRDSRCDVSRFNGKRGGYIFVEDAAVEPDRVLGVR